MDDNILFAAEGREGLEQSQGDIAVITSDEFEAAHGEKLAQALDLDTWIPGANLVEMYNRLEKEVAEAIRKEGEYQRLIRREIFPRLRTRPDAPPGAGVFKVNLDRLQEVHQQLLFNGAVEASDGTVVSHDTLPVTITQIGVCLVSYNGDQGTWVHRIFRRDLRTAPGMNPVDELMELLDRRRDRGAEDQPSPRDRFSSLARRGIMAYAERAVLLDRSSAEWRMGHGNPTPYELVTGSGLLDLLRTSLALLTRLVEHRRFVYVQSTTSARELLTIGNALNPLEYAIVDTNKPFLQRVAGGHYRGQGWEGTKKELDKFIDECGPKIITGMYRASRQSPAQVFYAHVDFAHEAALIALADSVLQEHRGFPMLIDLADDLCRNTFGADVFAASTLLAYASAGEPYRYFSERKTR
ncbi:MAG: hypothetical protein WAN11_01670 [Syntrophobacteraceae bacterium]